MFLLADEPVPAREDPTLTNVCSDREMAPAVLCEKMDMIGIWQFAFYKDDILHFFLWSLIIFLNVQSVQNGDRIAEMI